MKAHELLSDESKWCKGVLARDETGAPCNIYDRKAVSWCVIGALTLAYISGGYWAAIKQLRGAIEVTNAAGWATDIVVWAEASERTFAEVREMLVKLDI